LATRLSHERFLRSRPILREEGPRVPDEDQPRGRGRPHQPPARKRCDGRQAQDPLHGYPLPPAAAARASSSTLTSSAKASTTSRAAPSMPTASPQGRHARCDHWRYGHLRQLPRDVCHHGRKSRRIDDDHSGRIADRRDGHSAAAPPLIHPGSIAVSDVGPDGGSAPSRRGRPISYRGSTATQARTGGPMRAGRR
jgi:hypothetical protein